MCPNCAADYIVEKCEEGSGFWERLTGAQTGTTMAVKKLEPGKKYKFRVKAVNKMGNSEPLETKSAILAKNPYGKPPAFWLYRFSRCMLFKFTNLFCRPS